jgi:hypothetical protein
VGGRISRYLPPWNSLPPSPSTFRKSLFNWCAITAGTRIADGRGEREKRKQAVADANQPDLPVAVKIIDVSDYRPKKTPSPQWREYTQGHLLCGTSKRCGRSIRWNVRSVAAR